MAEPDTNNDAPTPIWGFGPPSPEPDTKKLDALLASLNGSAERFQTLWFSFLGLTLYLAIAALATTHRDLLLNNPQTLPILNIKVELLPFYVIAPLLYLVFHFYLLMMLALLARTAAEFDKQLRTTLPGEPERERYRAQVGNALFLQLLVGMKGERTGVNAMLMGIIALITIVLAPLATLVLMQMMFLPYHHLRITWWHRVVVVADLVLIVVMTYRCFFPRGVRKAPLVLGALSRKPRWATAMAFCVLLAVALAPLTYWLSFKEGRWAGEPRASSVGEWTQWMEGEPPSDPEINPDYSATEKGVVFGLFPDRLDLHDESIVGEKLLEETKKEIVSRGGDSVPTRTLDHRDLQAANLMNADLRGVSLSYSIMRGANLVEARLDGADLLDAQLQGAALLVAQLQGAALQGAQLQGAELSGAQLLGTGLVAAHLQGSDLFGAHLQGSDLFGAQLQGSDLSGAQLQGATLRGTQLQGSDLSGAQLQGADLLGAQLQGVNLSRADLADSALAKTFVFRANLADANLATAAVGFVYADCVKKGENGKPETLGQHDIDEWIASAKEFASARARDHIAKRFERLKPDFRDDPEQVRWSGMREASLALYPDGVHHRQQLAKFLGDLACDPANAPHIARGLVRPSGGVVYQRLGALGDQLAAFLARLEEGRKTPEKCPGIAGFTDSDWRALEAIKPSEAAPADR